MLYPKRKKVIYFLKNVKINKKIIFRIKNEELGTTTVFSRWKQVSNF